MTPFNQFIYEKSVERQIDLLRHREGLSLKVRKALSKHDINFSNKLAANLLRLSEKDLKRLGTAVGFNTSALKALRETLNSFERSSALVLRDSISDELDTLTKDEYDFQVSIIDDASTFTKAPIVGFSVLSLRNAKKYRSLEIAVDKSQSEQILYWAANRRRKVLSTIRATVINGGNTNNVLSEVAGTRSRAGGILKKTHFGAVLISNTFHNSATSAASSALKEENQGELDFFWSSILDGKTSGVCFRRHNKKIYKQLNGARPPAHPNCRSRTIPVFGDDTPINETVTQWFSRQIDDVKEKVLGAKKFAAYQLDKTKFSFPKDFISSKGDFYTLDQLRDRGTI